MFFDILYFISMTGFCVTTTGMIIYIYNERLAKKIAYNVSQYGLEVYANMLDFFDKIPEKGDEETILLYAEGQTRLVEPSLLYANDITDNDLVIFRKTENNTTLYKIMNDEKDLDVHSIDKPFLQVEICFGEDKIEIQHFLKKFYVFGNKFDEKFLKWFMDYFYEKKLGDAWELNIIDHSVNIVKLTQNNVILLNDNKYDIEYI